MKLDCLKLVSEHLSRIKVYQFFCSQTSLLFSKLPPTPPFYFEISASVDSPPPTK